VSSEHHDYYDCDCCEPQYKESPWTNEMQANAEELWKQGRWGSNQCPACGHLSAHVQGCKLEQWP
jgi:hypothetical protein